MLPQILGHEFAGTVVEVGDGVTDVKAGDLGAVYPSRSPAASAGPAATGCPSPAG
ncbi:alcohol dehydrogenase catalytic domain-containing protein [Streptomyces sp. NPDC057682]|uniref:alcohol dehydrogenase catalytic domain-containing protein n=1 Tax=Streptomyces sp. NPDC057682 TaxID=3346210 RepID=UPI0036C66C9E